MMKNLLYGLMGVCLLGACSPNDITLFDNSATVDEVKFLELRADHQTLLPNGKTKMEFHTVAYGIKEFTEYSDSKVNDTLVFQETVRQDTFVIPNDQLPVGVIKVYDESNNELANNVFSTTEPGVRSIRFYAKLGDLRSQELEIKIRELPTEEYTEVVYPVIFHLILPPTSGGPSYSVSPEELQKKLDRVSDIFNNQITTDPNGGNARIVFKLAEYDKNGVKLVQKGINSVQLDSVYTTSAQYVSYIQRKLIWNPNQYLNVWLAKFSSTLDEYASNSYKASAPKIVIANSGKDPLPGVSLKVVESLTPEDSKNYLDVGVMINYNLFFNPNAFNSNTFDIARVFGKYFGLFDTEYDTSTTGKSRFKTTGDTDYCPDTQFYNSSLQLIFKSNDLSGRSIKIDPIQYFTSFNIMDRYSRKNSVTVDQVKRIRTAVDRCPSRWSYKSTWAFTGKN